MSHLGTSFGSCHGNPELVALVAPLGTRLAPHPHWLVCMAGGGPHPRPSPGKPTPANACSDFATQMHSSRGRSVHVYMHVAHAGLFLFLRSNHIRAAETEGPPQPALPCSCRQGKVLIVHRQNTVLCTRSPSCLLTEN